MVVSIATPFPVFTDEDGQPLDRGYVYVGTANLDPLNNPENVYWDAAMTIPATQPIRTNGGFLVDGNGAPGNIYCATDFSISVRDRNNAELYGADAYGARFLADTITFDTLVIGTSALPDAAGGALLGSTTLPWSSVVSRAMQTRTLTAYNQADATVAADLAALNQRKSLVLAGRQTSTTATASLANIFNTTSITRTAAGTYSVAATVTLPSTYSVQLTSTLDTGFDQRFIVSARSTAGFTVKTYDNGAATDLPFDFVVFGNPAVADPIS